MWNNHKLLNAIADLLYLVAGLLLLTMGVVWLLRISVAPVRLVNIQEPLVRVQATELDGALRTVLHDNFLMLNLDVVRGELEKLPWVRRAEVRRRWPLQVEVKLEEHVAFARWGENGAELVNGFGELFAGKLQEEDARQLPTLYGPARSAPEVFALYSEATRLLMPLQLTASELIVTQRMAWQLRLGNGLLIMLGRDRGQFQVAQRLQRFAELYPSVIGRREPHPVAVDMRYPNGVAMRLAAADLRP